VGEEVVVPGIRQLDVLDRTGEGGGEAAAVLGGDDRVAGAVDDQGRYRASPAPVSR
jgi:hypothetical protein